MHSQAVTRSEPATARTTYAASMLDDVLVCDLITLDRVRRERHLDVGTRVCRLGAARKSASS